MDQKMDTTQLETAAAAVIGQIVILLSRLEFNLGLYLRNAVGGSDVDAVNPLIARLSFKSKLDALRDVVAHKFASDEQCRAEFLQWYAEMDNYRAKRNSFMHGRWAILPHVQQVVHVAPGLPNNKPQKELRYSLSSLREELSAANRIVSLFGRWSAKWPL